MTCFMMWTNWGPSSAALFRCFPRSEARATKYDRWAQPPGSTPGLDRRIGGVDDRCGATPHLHTHVHPHPSPMAPIYLCILVSLMKSLQAKNIQESQEKAEFSIWMFFNVSYEY